MEVLPRPALFLFGQRLRLPAALCLALFLVSFNVYVMTVLIPTVVRDLETTVAHVVSALVLFPLLMVSLVPTSQNLAAIYGQKSLLQAGLIIFGLGSLLTAISPNSLMLILGYAIFTGTAAAFLITTPRVLLDLNLQGRARNIGRSALDLAAVTGSVIGPVVGGVIATASDWRWAFVPQVFLAAIIWWLLKPALNSKRQADISIDWIGGLLSFLGLATVMVGTILANEYGWWQSKRIVDLGGLILPPFGLSIAPVLIAAGVIFLTIFLFYWRRRETVKQKAKLWQAGLFRSRRFIIGIGTGTLYMIAHAGLTFDLYLFLQASLDLTPLAASLAVLPYSIAMIVVLVLVLVLQQRLRPKFVIQLGLGLVAVGLVLLYNSMAAEFSPHDLLPGLVIAGAGAGMITGQMFTQILIICGDYPAQRVEATGIFGASQDMGYALGLTFFGVLLIYLAAVGVVDGVLEQATIIVDEQERQEIILTLEKEIQTLTDEEFEAMLKQQPQEIQQALDEIAPTALAGAMQTTLLAIILVVLVALVLSLLLPRSDKIR